MKRFLKSILVAFVVLIVVLPLGACDSSGLKKASKGLSVYTINANFDESDYSINAHQRVEFVNNTKVPLQNAAFHLYPNAFREGAKYSPVPQKSTQAAYPNGIDYGSITISNLSVDTKPVAVEIGGEDQNILIAAFPAALYPTAKYIIEFDFRLILPRVNHRFGYSENSVNLGNWYPIACVYQNGAYNTAPYYSNGDPFYSECANYNVNLTLPSDYIVASTAKSVEEKQSGNKSLHKMKALAVRDFALVFSKDFKVMTATEGNTELLYYYYGDEAPENSLEAAIDSLKTYNALFGKYPYPSLSVAETGFLHGGMEYPGLVYISDSLSGEPYLEVIIHEIAHQWWYALVGNNQLSEAWIDEGLAEYSVTLFFENNAKYNVSRSDRIMEAMQSYLLYTDVYKSITGQIDTSMNRSLNQYGEFEYVYMIYVKGQLMFDSLRKLVGDKSFATALKNLFSDCKFGVASTENVIAAFEDASKKELEPYFDAWLSGKVQILDI